MSSFWKAARSIGKSTGRRTNGRRPSHRKEASGNGEQKRNLGAHPALCKAVPLVPCGCAAERGARVSLGLYAPVLIGRGIDQILAPGQVYFDRLLPILIELIVVAILAALFQWLMTLCTNLVTYKTVRDLRISAFNKIEEVPLSLIDSRSHGDIISRIINDIDSISDGLLQGFSQLFTGVITIAITLVYMLTLNFKVGLVVVIITPLSLFVASFIAKHSFDMFRQQSAIKGKLSGCIEELVGEQKVVKAFRYEQRAQKEFDAINNDLYNVGVKAQFYSSLTNPCTRFVNSVVYAAVALVGALSCIAGGFTVGALSSFLTYANQYTKPFNEISGVVTELQTALASAKRVFAVIDEEAQQPDDADATHPTGSEGRWTSRGSTSPTKNPTRLSATLTCTCSPASASPWSARPAAARRP